MNYKQILAGLGLISFCALTWVWMLGYLALPQSPDAQMLQEWGRPGVMAFPATISIIAGLVGLCLIIYSRDNSKAQHLEDQNLNQNY